VGHVFPTTQTKELCPFSATFFLFATQTMISFLVTSNPVASRNTPSLITIPPWSMSFAMSVTRESSCYFWAWGSSMPFNFQKSTYSCHFPRKVWYPSPMVGILWLTHLLAVNHYPLTSLVSLVLWIPNHLLNIVGMIHWILLLLLMYQTSSGFECTSCRRTSWWCSYSSTSVSPLDKTHGCTSKHSPLSFFCCWSCICQRPFWIC